MCTLRREETTFHSSFVPMCQANTNFCLLSFPERIKGSIVLEEDPVGKLLTLQTLRTSIWISELGKKPDIALGNKDWWALGADCLCCRAKRVSFRFNQRPCLRKEGGEVIMERHLDLGFCLHTYQNRKNAHAHIYTHAHIHTLLKSTMAFSACPTSVLGWQLSLLFCVKNDVSSIVPPQLILSGNYGVSWTCMDQWPLFQPLYILFYVDDLYLLKDTLYVLPTLWPNIFLWAFLSASEENWKYELWQSLVN